MIRRLLIAGTYSILSINIAIIIQKLFYFGSFKEEFFSAIWFFLWVLMPYIVYFLAILVDKSKHYILAFIFAGVILGQSLEMYSYQSIAGSSTGGLIFIFGPLGLVGFTFLFILIAYLLDFFFPKKVTDQK